MNNKNFILMIATVFVHSYAIAQKAKSPATKKQVAPAVAKRHVIKDTLAFNIQTTINELNAYIRDDSQPVQVMLGNFLGTGNWGNSYSSLIKLPGSIENTFRRQSANRYAGIESWEWQSILVRTNKDQLPVESLISLKTKIDSIINAMPAVKLINEKNKVTGISAFENVSNPQYRYLYKEDEVGIRVQFVKPLIQTEQQTIDSLARVYGPGLSNAATAHDASAKYTAALTAEGFSDEKRNKIFADEVKVIADKDIKAAFQMLMGTYINQGTLTLNLTEQQRSEIRRMATEVVNAYNAKWEPVAPATSSQGAGGSYYQSQPTQPQGIRVRCSVCNGVGQYEKVMYSHTYDGIYNKVQTNITKWVVCEFCGGTGWVTKTTRKRH